MPAGVILLFNKPFKGGDYIEAQNVSGTVRSVGILYTTLTTPDNKTVHIPNGPLSTGNIINYSTQPTRRLDLNINVDYGSDVEQVKQLLLDIAEKHPKVLNDPPAPLSRMVKMGDSSIDFVLRVWTLSEDYWPVTFDLNEQSYEILNANGLNIPFPQMTVHLAKDQGTAKKRMKEDLTQTKKEIKKVNLVPAWDVNQMPVLWNANQKPGMKTQFR